MADPAQALLQANAVLAGQSIQPKEALTLVGQLRAARCFGVARKLLDRLSKDPVVGADPDLRLHIAQQRALATYKDPDLQTDEKLERALDILRGVEDLRTTVNQETLGLTGAIYKRRWEHTGSQRELDRSLGFYLRGYKQGVRPDYGYTAINAAFIHDVLADLESAESFPQKGPGGSTGPISRRYGDSPLCPGYPLARGGAAAPGRASPGMSDRADGTRWHDSGPAVPAAPAGGRCAGLGARWPGNGRAAKGREGAAGVDVDYALYTDSDVAVHGFGRDDLDRCVVPYPAARLRRLLLRFLGGHPIAQIRHPERQSIVAEAEVFDDEGTCGASNSDDNASARRRCGGAE